MGKRVVFLSQDSMENHVCDDDLALDAFAARGLNVETISWRSDAVWSEFDAVIVRSPWDYMKAPQQFLDTLDRIADSTRLANSVQVMRWNLDKRYLGELRDQGVAVVPTEYGESLTEQRLDELLGEYPEGAVIKPVISAGSMNTFALQPPISAATRAKVLNAHANSVYMWQPFVRSVVEEGEYSLFYFSGQFSHCIVKRPKSGDFRVQEEFGGQIVATEATADQLQVAESVLAAIPESLLYARVDLVRGPADEWWLIELEIIEPSLYLRCDAMAPERFADATAAWLDP
ncbi:MAG: hypothetical protein AAGL69_11540 [Pseudomonadota bacterium]